MSHHLPRPDGMNPQTAYIWDIGERVVMTFLMAFGALLLAANVFDIGNITNLALYQDAAIGGLAAVLSFAKGLIAPLVGRSDTAALLPADADHK